MRLVCPSCKENYEVPRTAVPIGGREVQCASCGHKWFQTRTKKTTDGDIRDAQKDNRRRHSGQKDEQTGFDPRQSIFEV